MVERSLLSARVRAADFDRERAGLLDPEREALLDAELAVPADPRAAPLDDFEVDPARLDGDRPLDPPPSPGGDEDDDLGAGMLSSS